MPWYEQIAVAWGILCVLNVVGLVVWAWAVSGGHKKPPITRDLDRHQDPDNYA